MGFEDLEAMAEVPKAAAVVTTAVETKTADEAMAAADAKAAEATAEAKTVTVVQAIVRRCQCFMCSAGAQLGISYARQPLLPGVSSPSSSRSFY